MKNIGLWMQVYEQKLVEAITKHPELYAYPMSEVPFIASRMREAFECGSYSKDSHAIRATCKHFGVKHTYTAIREFLQSEVQQ